MNGTDRPKAVTVIAWVWITLGCLMFISAMMGLLVSAVMSSTGDWGNAPPAAHVFLIAHRVLCVVQIVPSILAVIAGTHFLRLKSWARGVLEAITWLGLGFIIIFEIGVIIALCVIGARSDHGGGLILFGVFTIPAAAVWGVPGVILLRYLRSATVKNAMIGKASGSPIHSVVRRI